MKACTFIYALHAFISYIHVLLYHQMMYIKTHVEIEKFKGWSKQKSHCFLTICPWAPLGNVYTLCDPLLWRIQWNIMPLNNLQSRQDPVCGGEGASIWLLVHRFCALLLSSLELPLHFLVFCFVKWTQKGCIYLFHSEVLGLGKNDCGLGKP